MEGSFRESHRLLGWHQDTMTEEIEASSAIHCARDQLEEVSLSLGLANDPRERNTCGDRGKVLLQTLGKALALDSATTLSTQRG
jgi:hypothetical protein